MHIISAHGNTRLSRRQLHANDEWLRTVAWGGGFLIEKPADSAASFHLIGRLGGSRNWGDFLRWTFVMYKLMKIANLFAETGANYFKVWLMMSVEHPRVQTLTFGCRAAALYNSSGTINMKTFPPFSICEFTSRWKSPRCWRCHADT